MKCCLVGNQNSGKSLLFNLLTGMNQKVGNWPGVTIERKTGKIKGTDFEIVDLPGVYSLSPYTTEEKITRDFVLNDNPDLIINIIDSTNIERSLYLTTQLLELDAKVLVVLNMQDILKKKGYTIDVDKLQDLLGTSCVSISALKNKGVAELLTKIKNDDILPNNHIKIYDEKTEKFIEALSKEIVAKGEKNARYRAVKMFERDLDFVGELKDHFEQYENLIEQVEKENNVDSEQLIATSRYDFIESVRDQSVTKEKVASFTEKIDKVLLNRWAAIPIFIVIMSLVFTLSVGLVGGFTVGLVDAFFNGFEGSIPAALFFTYEFDIVKGSFIGVGPWFGGVLEGWGAPVWLVSLFTDGIIAGFGAVCNFLPQLVILFLLIALLETSGYMSRVTFMFDHFFKKIGLSGKSLIPFIVGIGCSVPAVMGARTIEDENEKKLTVTLTPFVPCSAKLPIIACFIGGLFPLNTRVVATLSIYFLAVAVIIFSGWLLNKFFIKNKNTSYLTELPDYHSPSARYIAREVADKTFAFIKRAGTIIVLCSIGIWVLANLGWNFQYIEPVEVLDLSTIDPSLLNEAIKPLLESHGITVVDGQLVGDAVADVVKYVGPVDAAFKGYDLTVYGYAYAQIDGQYILNEATRTAYFASVGDSIMAVDKSMLATIGKTVAWIFYPMLGCNMSWAATVSAVQGLVAKEMVVASMEVINAVQEGGDVYMHVAPDAQIYLAQHGLEAGTYGFSFFVGNGFAAYGYMIFTLFSAPCFGAIGAMKRELGDNKSFGKAILFQTVLALALASIVGVWGVFLN